MAIVRRPLRLVAFASVALFFWYNFLYVDWFSSTGRAAGPGFRRTIRFVKSSVDWSEHKQFHPAPADDAVRLPRGKPRSLPRVQHNFPPPRKAREKESARERTLRSRRDEVRRVFERGWRSYRERAWLQDELAPVTGKGRRTFGGWGATLVDALDTLWIMGFRDEFREAAGAAAAIDWGNTTESSINVFETTIRHLGGLLSAHDLSGEKALLDKAVELGDMLYAAFDTPNRMPPFWLHFAQSRDGELEAGSFEASASPASLALEFTRLAQLTGEDRYYDAVDRVARALVKMQNTTQAKGLWPMMLNFRDLKADSNDLFTLGAQADSLYEYFPKMYALLGGLEPKYEKLYRDAMDATRKMLLFRPMAPGNPDVLFSGDAQILPDGDVIRRSEGQHLGCFVGGMFGLGGKLFGIEEHVGLGEKLAMGCSWAYKSFPTGVMPEIFECVTCPSLEPCEWDEEKWTAEKVGFAPKGFKSVRDAKYILRPEAIESMFLLYRMTGKEEFVEDAWRMFQAIERSTMVEFGNSAIVDVMATGETQKSDSMESFWFAETLKYFYLIFSPPEVISLDEYVFNTEAHPLRRPK